MLELRKSTADNFKLVEGEISMGKAMKDLKLKKRIQGLWYSPHMAAASHAISERIQLVDLIVELRDARIPLSSECEILRNCPASTRNIIALNKMDLADQSKLQEWMKYFRERNFISYGVNSHNKENIRKFLSLIQNQVRELKRTDHTATVMLVGIPNVGKSALANSLHQIGRTSAAEKGKLKHATVSPEPGETRDIRSFKIASHPNIYVLDTPGVLPPEILDVDVCSKLILTGAIKDLIGTKELAQYFLAILNRSEQYKNWANLSSKDKDMLSLDCTMEFLNSSESHVKQRRQSPTDHTQDCIVRDVRQTLFETISAYEGDTNDEEEMETLISIQFGALQKVFHVSSECPEEANVKVGKKLLDLFRTGRLGHYMLDLPPGSIHFN
ncbi:DAR GTPase 2, mitochondrial-like isoform X1 [Prosopis cineraria]|uniref:DAR GTPase 2, mitochondrial-like isoform X1 n=2 Tax=Prosopis cineraria TaxID=364024 RepID=UPI00240EFBC5|nr:DAR GTPase 2, mitochondrial-like isoform X1 [Prosopis cineraria]